MEIRYASFYIFFGTFTLMVWSSIYESNRTRNRNDGILYKSAYVMQTVRKESSGPPSDHYPSTLYDVTYTSLGLTFRVQHMTDRTRQLSTWTVSGEGLRNANVGKRASLTVRIDNASLAEFNKKTFVSVLAVGRNHVFVAKPSRQYQTIEGLSVSFTYVPTITGIYELYVEEISAQTQKQISGSPFRLKVTGPAIEYAAKRRESNRKPSCQTIPQKNYTWLDGDWITRELAGRVRGTLRSGWVFQPKLCSFDIFTKVDLAIAAASHSPTTIAILGTSTERGVFLSLIDLALRSDEKLGLHMSDVGKCWGYTRVSLGNLTFIYQDLRIFNIAQNSQATCHNEKLASASITSLQADAMVFMKDFLFKDRSNYPTVILITVRDANQLRLMVDQIPTDWKGTIYPVNNFRTKFGAFYTAHGQMQSAQEMKEFVSVDPRVQTFNGFGLGAGMRHATESSPLIMKLNHFHRWCDELNGEMRVCGNPTEMVAQLLLGKALAPTGKNKWSISVGRAATESQSIGSLTTRREIDICFDCPASLLPFHVKVKPELECYRSNTGFKARNESNVSVWNGSMCPDDCMKTKPVDMLYTQSETVEVRVCQAPN